MVCIEITDCGKSEQNPASCYYLLVVKLVVKGKWLLLRVLFFIPRKYPTNFHHMLNMALKYPLKYKKTDF